MNRKQSVFAVLITALFVFAIYATWTVAQDDEIIHACVDKDGKIRIVGSELDCDPKKDTYKYWNVEGPQGEPGIGDLGCESGQVARWNGSEWSCADYPDVAALEARIAELENLLIHFSRDENEITISGANLHVENGTGTTDGTPNALGNVIIGYNEPGVGVDRRGSHMLVVGKDLNYSGFGGLIVGYSNTVIGEFASVSGGQGNTAFGDYSSVSGGISNMASGEYSSVSGGYDNTASGYQSSVSGGKVNTASGNNSSVSGGYRNTASGEFASVSGGQDNTASGERGTSVSGGNFSTASGNYSSVSGGISNMASGEYSSVSGGSGSTASSLSSSVSGGISNIASGDNSSVSGGFSNIASGLSSSVSGGKDSEANGDYDWAAGGLWQDQ